MQLLTLLLLYDKVMKQESCERIILIFQKLIYNSMTLITCQLIRLKRANVTEYRYFKGFKLYTKNITVYSVKFNWRIILFIILKE